METYSHDTISSRNTLNPCTRFPRPLLYLPCLLPPLSRFHSLNISSQFSASIVTTIIDTSHLHCHHSLPYFKPSVASPARWLLTCLLLLVPERPGLPHLSPTHPLLPAQPHLPPQTGRVPTGDGVLALVTCHHHPALPGVVALVPCQHQPHRHPPTHHHHRHPESTGPWPATGEGVPPLSPIPRNASSAG